MARYLQNLMRTSVLRVAGRVLAPAGSPGDIQAMHRPLTDRNRADVRQMRTTGRLCLLTDAQYRKVLDSRVVAKAQVQALAKEQAVETRAAAEQAADHAAKEAYAAAQAKANAKARAAAEAKQAAGLLAKAKAAEAARVTAEAEAESAPVEDAPPISLAQFSALSDAKEMREYIRELGIDDDIDLRGKRSMLRDYKLWLAR